MFIEPWAWQFADSQVPDALPTSLLVLPPGVALPVGNICIPQGAIHSSSKEWQNAIPGESSCLAGFTCLLETERARQRERKNAKPQGGFRPPTRGGDQCRQCYSVTVQAQGRAEMGCGACRRGHNVNIAAICRRQEREARSREPQIMRQGFIMG